ILDGNEGVIIINPPKEVFTKYLEKKRKYVYFEKELLKLKDMPAETVDGYRVELLANIEFPEEIKSVLEHGAEGIGLFRTEYLYLDRKDLPGEEEQFEAYKFVAQSFKGKQTIIRTLDLGGDKIEPHLNIESESNPALGVRAIRYAFRRKPIFKQQLRAILRAALHGNLKIMLPMISGIAEFRQAQEVLAEVKMDLWNQGIPYKEDVEVGSMIEIPSAAVTADLLAKEVDFFSLGTNDLIQYSMAIDRGNEQVAYLYQPLHPAILRTIKTVITAAHSEGIPVGMCGEMAGDPLCTLIMLGLEVDELSMNAISIPNIKQIIRSVKYEEAVALTNHVFSLSTYKEIENFVTHEISHRFPEIFCSYN
ncbi:MAG: phosphoenolpyruvate--protein phosphotransferase, partial [bacterium]